MTTEGRGDSQGDAMTTEGGDDSRGDGMTNEGDDDSRRDGVTTEFVIAGPDPQSMVRVPLSSSMHASLLRHANAMPWAG